MSANTRSTTGGPARRRDRAGHTHAAAAARRERAQHRSEEKEGRLQIIDLLRRRAGVTHILATIATENDTAEDVVRRARLLHTILAEVTEGGLTLPGVKPQKALRSLAFLDSEIAWLENAASGSRAQGAARSAPDAPGHPVPAFARSHPPTRETEHKSCQNTAR